MKKIQKHGGEIIGKTFFETGTGRAPLLPAAFWLCGASETITVDLNPYMRKEFIEDMLFYIKTKKYDIKNIFGGLLREDRFGQLLEYSNSKGKPGQQAAQSGEYTGTLSPLPRQDKSPDFVSLHG
ncbi:MAG: hypothetical protein LBD55_06540 [Treponema sp.]|nr:hypothetical protein [Treponema sp.]